MTKRPRKPRLWTALLLYPLALASLLVAIGGIDAQYLQAVLMGGANETGYWMQDFLYSWAWTISGGSSEIQRNIIGERGLGLPREPQAKAA